jgi:ubiquinone/menaquinone biosynthesis C-methylase UbiE
MRVLDLGFGVGDVSLLAAEIAAGFGQEFHSEASL